MGRRLTELEVYNMDEVELRELIEDVFPPQETDMPEPMKTAPPDEMIGFLTTHPSGKRYGFLCFNCAAVEDVYVGAPVYGINLNPYRATCCVCKRLVVSGCGTELFNGD